MCAAVRSPARHTWLGVIASLACATVCLGSEQLAVGPDGQVKGGAFAAFGQAGGGMRLPGTVAAGSPNEDVVGECQVEWRTEHATAIMHTFHCAPAEFGGAAPAELVSPIAMPAARDGCTFPGPGAMDGRVAVVVRGSCSFETKAANMQEAGAVAVVVINNEPSAVFAMPPGGAVGRKPVTVPVLMAASRDGVTLESAATSTEVMDPPGEWIIVIRAQYSASALSAQEARLLDTLQARPLEVDAHRELEQIYKRTGRLDEAMHHSRALRRAGTVRKLHELEAEYEASPPGDSPEARAQHDRYVAKRADLLMTLGRQAAKEGVLDESARAFAEAARILSNGDNPASHATNGHGHRNVEADVKATMIVAALQGAADALDDMGYLEDATSVLRELLEHNELNGEAQYQLAMVMLRRCQVHQPAVRFEFQPAVPPLNSLRGADGGAPATATDDEPAAPIAAVPPPRSFDCPYVRTALTGLREASAGFEQGRRLKRVVSDWDTELDFWAATFGGKEALYEWASEPLKQKLRHDIEQMDYLQHLRFANSSMDPQDVPFSPVAHALRHLLVVLETNHGNTPNVLDAVLSLDPHQQAYVAETFNVQTYFPPAYRLGSCGRDPLMPCLNPDLDRRALQAEYYSEANAPGIMVVDDLLTDTALNGLRALAEEGTVWHMPSDGYVGTTLETGFASETLLRVALELREAFPDVICEHALRGAWANKYDNTIVPVSDEEHAAWVSRKAVETEWRRKHKHAPFNESQALAEFPHAATDVVSRPREEAGLGVHCDDAAINVNLWITRRGASADDTAGGLVIYRKPAPQEWQPLEMYGTGRESAAWKWLESEGATAEPLVVPHRANRAVIFDSRLYHETDGGAFRRGYTHRRTSVTLVFGYRGDTCEDVDVARAPDVRVVQSPDL